jgi:hypothetical protein
VLFTQANGMSVLHETVFENRLVYVPALQKMGCEIEVFAACLGGPACRFHDGSSVASASPSALSAPSVQQPRRMLTSSSRTSRPSCWPSRRWTTESISRGARLSSAGHKVALGRVVVVQDEIHQPYVVGDDLGALLILRRHCADQARQQSVLPPEHGVHRIHIARLGVRVCLT